MGERMGTMDKIILIVDEDSTVAEDLKKILTGYECLAFDTGEQALQYIEEHKGRISLLICGPQLKDMDGYTLLEKEHVIWQEDLIPKLMVVDAEQQEQVKKAFEYGAKDILIRPVDAVIAKNRIDNVLAFSASKELHNVMEDIVEQTIEENINNLGICTCPICRRDLLSLVLNRVPPKYVSSRKGAMLTKVGSDMSYDSKITLVTEIARCAQIVKENPNH